MEQDIIKTAFDKVFEAFPFKKFEEVIRSSVSDRYIKKMKSIKLLYLMIISQYCAFESLHDIAGRITNDEKLQKALRLTSISASTLARHLRKVDHRVWEQTFTAVKKTTWQHTSQKHPGTSQYQLNVIDSSTISLCLTKFLWADFRCTKSGIKLHQSIMEELVVMDPNVLIVFDRGYVDYKIWDKYCENRHQICFPLKKQRLNSGT